MKYHDAKIEDLSDGFREKLNSLKIVDGDTKMMTGLSKGMFLTGGTGSGKTYAMHAIKKRALGLGIRTCLDNWVEFIYSLKNHLDYLVDNIEAKFENQIVMLDDVGAEKLTDWTQEILYLVVNKAYEKEKTLFIATNLNLEQFRERYGDRILSRIYEMCELVELTSGDKRIK